MGLHEDRAENPHWEHVTYTHSTKGMLLKHETQNETLTTIAKNATTHIPMLGFTARRDQLICRETSHTYLLNSIVSLEGTCLCRDTELIMPEVVANCKFIFEKL